MDIFEQILKCRSMTAIVYKIEAAFCDEVPIDELMALHAMLNTNDLDEVWAIAHEQLGHVEEAQTLRTWIANKPKRPYANS
jgi:hypothetical protein